MARRGRLHQHLIQVKPESRDYIATWASDRGIENYVASANIEARKPQGDRVNA